MLTKELDALENVVLSVHFKSTPISIEFSNEVLFDVLSKLSTDHQTYFENIPRVLSILEKHHSTGISVLIPLFQELYNSAMTELENYAVDLSFLPKETHEETPKAFFDILDKTFSKSGAEKIRIGEFRLDLEGVDDKTQLNLISLIFDGITHSGEKLMWEDDYVQNAMIELATLWDLLNRNSKNELFYIACGQVIDRFASSGFGQLTRDFAEETILISYKDGLPHLGFLAAFKCYSNLSSFQAALIYVNLSLINVIRKKRASDKFVFDIVWESIKVFRNMGLYDIAIAIFNTAPKNLNLSGYERRSLSLTYFSTLLKAGKLNECHKGVSEFLDMHREEIISGGVSDVKPWLVLIYNLQRLLSPELFRASQYPSYVQIFESIVPSENLRPVREITLGEPKFLKPLIKDALIKLAYTRSPSDAVKENTTPITMASRIIEKAVQQSDFEALFLSSMLKTDISLSFLDKESEGISQVVTPTLSEEEYTKLYGSFDSKVEALIQKEGLDFVWLLHSEHSLYQYSIFDGEMKAMKLLDWNHEYFNKLRQEGFFSNLSFDDTVKTDYEVRDILPEEHTQKSREYTDQLEFAKLVVTDNDRPIVFFNDMEISGFPNNLFFDEKRRLIHSYKATCNALSCEWLLKKDSAFLSKNFSKAIWIPTEGGDFTINQLKGKLEDILQKESITSTEKLIPDSPLNAEINILSSHGDSSIALKQAIYPDDNPRINLNSYIGDGKLLIFLVCHSGSISTTPFENSVSLVAKDFLKSGYSSVIAPFWSLHINIVSPWLEALLYSLNNGEPIINAVFEANKVIFKLYPTIAAWSCMHLYGDPTLRLEV